MDGAIRKVHVKPPRSQTEMMLDMLRVCFAEPLNISTVMLRAGFSWRMTMKFSAHLLGKGLLRQVRIDGHRLFHTTVEGRDAVLMWNKLRDVLQV